MALPIGLTVLIVVVGAGAATVLVSHLVEVLRKAPAPPEALSWGPGMTIRYLNLNGVRLRYALAGTGPPLLLLHTLRTQLDMFQKIIPLLTDRFQVHALDYPGHGFSDIPPGEYSAEFFIRAVSGFLEQLDLKRAVVVGESIGASIALVLAARNNPRLRAVVAINPYDYDRGRGLRRSSALANLFFGLNDVPILGATVTRLRNLQVVRKVLEGGVHRADSLPDALAGEMYRVGNRRGHYRAFMALVHHWPDWARLPSEYPAIRIPVLLLYGDHDWSRPPEREATARAVPGSRMQTLPDTGHFASLDSPEPIVRAILQFAAPGLGG